MTTAQEFTAKLEELKKEQISLLASVDRRKKVVRLRIQEITNEFYKTKELWKATLGPTTQF